jgi:hypothetical protein
MPNHSYIEPYIAENIVIKARKVLKSRKEREQKSMEPEVEKKLKIEQDEF